MRARHTSPLLLLHMLAWLLATCHASVESAAESATESLISPQTDTHPLVDRLTHSLSAKQVKKVVQKAPEKLNLGADNWLGSGLKRKSVSGAYGTTAAVGVGAAAITYQTMNLKSKNREARKKAEKDARVKEAICAAQRQRAAEAAETDQQPSVLATEYTPSPPGNPNAAPPNAIPTTPTGLSSPSTPPPAEGAAAGSAYAYPPSRALSWSKRTATRTPYAYPPSRVSATWSRRAPISDATLVTIEDYNKLIGATEAITSGTIAIASA
ncbi:uncharacterized protein SRS1_12945 [Sporisorium reilianum f. sp. reilianum]|uniref:Uncharacterized protein n=1 Tax=Sporisorium reilianum f. sp. reilianum TaxID=72559 RepID=A0A2N8UAQ4_9BASI|nr:uncharacterized protein SRS1_12945 [Sporisorium reilianum f. sp. reilianum]